MYINSFYGFIIKIQRYRLHVSHSTCIYINSVYWPSIGCVCQKYPPRGLLRPRRLNSRFPLLLRIKTQILPAGGIIIFICAYLWPTNHCNIVRPYSIETDNPPPTLGWHSRRSPARWHLRPVNPPPSIVPAHRRLHLRFSLKPRSRAFMYRTNSYAHCRYAF